MYGPTRNEKSAYGGEDQAIRLRYTRQVQTGTSLRRRKAIIVLEEARIQTRARREDNLHQLILLEVVLRTRRGEVQSIPPAVP